MIVWFIVFGILFSSTAYLFVFAALSYFSKRAEGTSKEENFSQKASLCICVPSYGNDSTIVYTVRKNLAILKASRLQFQYFVLSDHQSTDTVEELKRLGAKVFEVDLEKSTKAKALSQFFKKIDLQEDWFFLLDVDNLLSPEAVYALERFSGKLPKEKTWYQFERISANSNSTVAVFDTWSEKMNNRIFRKGTGVIGLSPALIGSGILAPTKEYVRHNLNIPEFITGGFDKWLDHILLETKTKVKYLENTTILDEKISDLDQLQQQRTRWISAQIFIAKKLFVPTFLSLITLKWLRFLKYFQLYVIPRVWHLMLSVFALIASTFYSMEAFNLLALNYVVLCLAILLASKGTNLLMLARAGVQVVFKIVWRYVKVVFGLKKAGKSFMVTQQTHKPDEDRN